jgi:hypothetical protein
MGPLRKWFGPSREEVWRQLSAAVNGRFIDGGFFGSDKVEVEHGPWIVTLDNYTVSTGKATIVFTRMRAPYVNPDSFRFTIYRKGLFSEIGKWFGMQDIVVGDPVFDEAFIIKGNDERKVRALFADPKLRELIAAQPDIHLEVKDDERWFGKKFPEGVDELCFQVTGIIKDVDRLEKLFALFAETLDQLCRIGSAYESSAGVVL